MFFSQDQRERTKAENPDASFGTYCVQIILENRVANTAYIHVPLAGEIGRILGATWKQMSDAQKKPYNDMAERDKIRAEQDKAAYGKKSKKAANDSD